MSTQPCIDRVLVHPRDPGMVVLRVGDRRIGPIRRDDADKAGATEGRRWTAALATSMQALADEVGCRADALRRLGRRDMTRALLQERLTAKWGEALAQRVVAALERDGWIDDAAYAQRRAASLQARRPMAAERVQEHLESEGVSAARARKAARTARDDGALDQAMARWKKERRDAAWIARTLGRQGFEFDTIVSALHKAGIPCNLEA